jgi:hypothetical protein
VANKAAMRGRLSKREQVQAEEALIVEDGACLAALKEFGTRSNEKKPKKQVCAKGGKLTQRQCGRCNQTGHNTHTYKQAVEVDSYQI